MTLGKRNVEGYEQNGYPLRGSNISMDRHHTSIPLVFKTKSKEMRIMTFLRTNEAAHYVTNDKKEKPYTYKIYNFTKVGIDIPDERMGSLNYKQKTKKWTLVVLAYVLDMTTVNSQAIYAMNTRDTSTKSFEFGWELMILLIKPHMSNRITIGSLTINLEESIRVYLDQGREVNPPPPNNGKAQVCRVCQKEKYGPGYKKEIDTLGKARCSKCDHHLCGKHTFVICQTCFENK